MRQRHSERKWVSPSVFGCRIEQGWVGKAGLGSEGVNLALGLCRLVFLSGGQEVLWGPVQSSPHQTLLNHFAAESSPRGRGLRTSKFPQGQRGLAGHTLTAPVGLERQAHGESPRPECQACSGPHPQKLAHRSWPTVMEGTGGCAVSGVIQAEPLSEMQGHS